MHKPRGRARRRSPRAEEITSSRVTQWFFVFALQVKKCAAMTSGFKIVIFRREYKYMIVKKAGCIGRASRTLTAFAYHFYFTTKNICKPLPGEVRDRNRLVRRKK
jgi:hypothetical protein